MPRKSSQKKKISSAAESLEGQPKPSADKPNVGLDDANAKLTTTGSAVSKHGHSKRKGSARAKPSSSLRSPPEIMSPVSAVSQAEKNVQMRKTGVTSPVNRTLRPPNLGPMAQYEDNPPLSYDSTRRSGLLSPSSTSRTSATLQHGPESSDSFQPSITKNYPKLPIGDSSGARLIPPTTIPLLLREVSSPPQLEQDQCMSPGNVKLLPRDLFSPQDIMSPMNAAGKQNETQSFLAYGTEQRQMLFSYFAVSLTVVAFCVLLTALLFLSVPADPQDIVCTTASCTALDSLLEASVDWTRPPCTNFYAHVCSGWAQSHNFSVYRSHLHEFIGDVHWILARVLVPSHAQTPPQVVAAFYQSCTAVLVDGADELAPFRHQLQIAGVTWPRVFAKSSLMLTAASVYATFQVTALLRIRSSVRNSSSVLEVAPDETFLRGWLRARGQLLRSGAYARFLHGTKEIYVGNESSPGHLLDYQSFVRVEEVVLATLLQRIPITGESVDSNIEEMLVGQLIFGRFVLWKVDAEDHDYVRTMAEVIARAISSRAPSLMDDFLNILLIRTFRTVSIISRVNATTKPATGPLRCAKA
ncbi:uncharacterized protein LOC144095404 [Amblyomma americanum]